MATYASYTYAHPSFIVRYPHLRRFEMLGNEIDRQPVKRWLDYGAGDGEVYRYHAARGNPVEAVLYEPDADIIAQNTLDPETPHTIVSRIEEIEGQFDLITALEVLEHLPLPERQRFYDVAAKHLAPGGRILVEVPIEYGPILLLKEFGRRVLKGRASDYQLGELLKATFLGRINDARDRYSPDDTRSYIYAHHGFDIGRFEREIAGIGTITRERDSPLPLLPSWLNQCRIYELRLS
jgi:SAM-dependent methyltransferase